jgi:putative hemolysin
MMETATAETTLFSPGERSAFAGTRRANVPLSLRAGGWTVKTLEGWNEVEASLRLRHDVFHLEHHGRRLPTGLDVDEVDSQCDHVGVFDVDGNLRASYRLTATSHSKQFYASRRFDLAAFVETPGVKLELGRACVAPGQRNGIALHLLWRGIAAYAQAVGATHLFGSASVRTTDMGRARALYEWLRARGHATDRYPVRVRPEARALDATPATEPGPIPSLFASYLRAGACIVGEPAKDPFLGSVDFLAVLELETMSARFRRKYGLA